MINAAMQGVGILLGIPEQPQSVFTPGQIAEEIRPARQGAKAAKRAHKPNGAERRVATSEQRDATFTRI